MNIHQNHQVNLPGVILIHMELESMLKPNQSVLLICSEQKKLTDPKSSYTNGKGFPKDWFT